MLQQEYVLPNAVKKQCDISIFNDIKYGDTDRNTLDLYLPNRYNFPILIFVHGGGWSSGDKDLYGHIGKYFTKNGFGTAIVNYRLSPEVKHPTHVEDIAKAFSWIYDNIEDYSGNKNEIHMMGHSSGAHTIAMLSSNENFLEAYNRSIYEIKKIVLISGVYAINNYIYYAGYGSKVFDRRNWKSSSPINFIPKAEKCLIMYAEKDYMTLAGQSIGYYDHLKKHNINSSLVVAKKENHESIIITACLDCKDHTKEIITFLKSS